MSNFAEYPVIHDKMSYIRYLILIISVTVSASVHAQTQTYVIHSPSENEDHYINNVVMTRFKGRFYCMWQSSAKDEDSPDTHVMYSTSHSGKTWSQPKTLAQATDTSFASPGGWIVHDGELTAFINIFRDIKTGGTAHYMTSSDGRHWSGMMRVHMDGGDPMDGIMEQDPHIIDGGRIIGAAHFRPGLKARPIYTDDPTGHGGWKIGRIEMEDRGTQSRGIEPSLYVRADGSIVMLFRDQASSFMKLAAESRDRGESWTRPYLTDLIDSRSKQCAGNLPDGRAFIVGNPATSKDRTTLAVSFSDDGVEFDKAVILRSPDGLSKQRYKGKYKTLGYSYPKAVIHRVWLYVTYSENKEKAMVTRIRIR